MRKLFRHVEETSENASLGSSIRSGISLSMMGGPTRRQLSPRHSITVTGAGNNLRAWMKSTTRGVKQYTIKPKKRFESTILNWMDAHQFPFMNCYARRLNLERHNPDAHNYRPSQVLFNYINWTFTGTWTEVIITFMIIYFVLMVIFAVFLFLAGRQYPACIVTSGSPFGDNSSKDSTMFSDAFALSWTTFTTVGYGMVYTAVGTDFDPKGLGEEQDTDPYQCSLVVTLCTMEAFLGLLYAGMCAAILFGKVNRVQSHANVIFANSVCVQYEWAEEGKDDDEEEDEEEVGEPYLPRTPPRTLTISDNDTAVSRLDSHDDKVESNGRPHIDRHVSFGDEEDIKNTSEGKVNLVGGEDEENPLTNDSSLAQAPQDNGEAFIDQFNGCPILKFQVINSQCNMEGAELVDAIMKVIGIKFKGHNGKITRSEYVRVNLVDFEHPFFSRVWHGVHVLDATSPLLTDKAKQRILANNGSWPIEWFQPDVIRTKLEFHDLIMTVAGISNISALTVHAYKRYKIGDVLIGYNFAPLVFRDKESGMLTVDKSLVHDVREQDGLEGEDLSVRRLSAATIDSPRRRTGSAQSNILIERAETLPIVDGEK